MPTTPRGIIYPDSSGNTRLWEHLENLAESSDDALDALLDALFPQGRPHIEWGTANITIPNATLTGTLAKVFDTPFGSAPVVLCTVQDGPNSFWAQADSITVNGFNARASRAATGAATFVTTGWLAIGI